MRQPELSIVVATYRRERVLVETIEALLALEGAEIEILVVDQTPAHEPEVEAALSRRVDERRIRRARLAAPNIPAAMNCGLRLARAPIVLFVDDDVIPSPDLARAHLAAHRAGRAALIAGRVIQPWDISEATSASDPQRTLRPAVPPTLRGEGKDAGRSGVDDVGKSFAAPHGGGRKASVNQTESPASDRQTRASVVDAQAPLTLRPRPKTSEPSGPTNPRHCERSEAIHVGARRRAINYDSIVGAEHSLSRTEASRTDGLLRFARNDGREFGAFVFPRRLTLSPRGRGDQGADFAGAFIGCNFSVFRAVALEIGGFDENFTRAAYRFEAEFAGRLRKAGYRLGYDPRACLRHLKSPAGGTRAFSDHLRTMKPDHSVGEYYWLLRSWAGWPSLRAFAARPLKAVATRHHLRAPWWIPATLIGEAAGAAWAVTLALRGPKFIAP